MPVCGERVWLKGVGKYWTDSQYEAHVIEIGGEGDKAGTVKVQYADGGFKRFKLDDFSKFKVENSHMLEFGTKDYEWSDDQYNPVNELDLELGELQHDLHAAVKARDFHKAQEIKNQIIKREAHKNLLRIEQANLKAAVRVQNFDEAEKIQTKIDQIKADKKQAEAAQPAAEKLSFQQVYDKACAQAFRGGLAGSAAMILQVTALMWMRTTMNYQYRYGTTTREAMKALYKQGGVPRFYQGIVPALAQGPLSRFGDTAANVGALAILNNIDSTRDLPSGVKTLFASASAAGFRIFLMPIDTVKTIMQVEGKEGIPKLKARLAANGPKTMYNGALGAAAATFAGHYPWFATYNTLDGYIPVPVDLLPKLGRNAFMGFCSSVVSDCTSNSIRVLKTYRQTAEVQVSYMEAANSIIAKDGLSGLFLRGLGTRVLANGVQGMAFSVLWKYFQEKF